MTFLYILLVLFANDYNDPLEKRENSTSIVMNVTVEVVSGSFLIDHISQNVIASSNTSKYQIGYKEFTITFPYESEIITGDVQKECQSDDICSAHMTANIEKLNENTGKVRIHYLIGNSAYKEPLQKTEKHIASIIYL